MFSRYALKTPHILLPRDDVDMRKWAVIACDQFTAQPDYWQRVSDYVGDTPSTLHLIYPEAWLNQGSARIERINSAMLACEKDVLTRHVDGFVLVERQVQAGLRLGLMAAIDLEAYDFSPTSDSLIRATEGTIQSRIPPRVRIRENATLELPHVLLLMDDPERTVIEPLYARRGGYDPLYDFDLMEAGGHIRAWRVSDPEALLNPLEGLMNRCGGLLFAVGDGNHSLATARQCWLNLRDQLSPDERLTHPARYALVEINNIHSPAMAFEPIHRLIIGVGIDSLRADLAAWLSQHGMDLADAPQDEAMFTLTDGQADAPLRITALRDPLPLRPLQAFLDDLAAANAQVSMDYIHGEAALRQVARGGVGILLPPFRKDALFASVRQGGSLPRKTFSLGEATDKRYYLECRKIH